MYNKLMAMVTTYNQYTDSRMEVSLGQTSKLLVDDKEITWGTVECIEECVTQLLRVYGLLEEVRLEYMEEVGKIHIHTIWQDTNGFYFATTGPRPDKNTTGYLTLVELVKIMGL